jgi:2-keto-3-deoxy-L-rhamnonate aldolase RhmA
VSLGARDGRAPEVTDAVRRIADAARTVGKPVAVMANSREEGDAFVDMGASALILSSDQGFLRRAAAQILRDFRT